MKSPFADCDALLVREPATAVFRGEEYDYVYSCYECPETKERFTTAELDEVNTAQVYNQYREKYRIPYPDDIQRIKKEYNLSNAKLGAILGFGENQISRYIDGEIPNKANGKVLNVINDVNAFLAFVDQSREQLGEKRYLNIMSIIEKEQAKAIDPAFSIIFQKQERSINNGYAVQNLKKLREIIMLSLSLLGDTYMTKLNKILFYCDMLCYRETGFGMTGLAYKSEQYGIIPFRSDKIYSILEIPREVKYVNGLELSPFVVHQDIQLETISEREKDIISSVCLKFRASSSTEISTINHKETVWKEFLDTDKPIPYSKAFTIEQI